MTNTYYVKDIHKSIEALLYGLYVYQYLLDTSTFGLIIRSVLQDRLLSLKTMAPTLRVAIYSIIAVAFLAFLRHLHAPDRYAVIIDFIGNVSTPSRARLLWLDGLIVFLQITEALVVFNIVKDSGRSNRSASRPPRIINNRPRNDATREQTNNTSTTDAGAGSSSQPPRGAPLSAAEASSGASSSEDPPRSSSPLFEYEDASNSRGRGSMSEYYVDDEEVRYSLDGRSQPSQRQTSEQHRRNGGSRSSLNEEEQQDSDGETSISSLGEDYEEILEQETFIFQLTFKDLLAYLLSNQEPITLPPPRAASSSTSTPSSSDRVQNLPV
ncbi:hypothetical protein BGZ59_004496 [Podila verticillata]|nr:hypothetical protein BGZ59_004496 [Podila verticillata]